MSIGTIPERFVGVLGELPDTRVAECDGRCCTWVVPAPEGAWMKSRPASNGIGHVCTEWDEKTRLCKIYEWRPAECREYPDIGGACMWCGGRGR